MTDITDQIKELNEKIGPKRIETEGVKTEDQNIRDLAAVARTIGDYKPVFSNFLGAQFVPKGRTCEDTE